MSRQRTWWVCAFVLLLAWSVTACHKRAPVVAPAISNAPTPVASRPPAPPPPPPRPATTPAASPRVPLSEEDVFLRKSLAELNAERPLSDVFFDYDAAALGDDDRAALQRNAAWLLKWKRTAVEIDGHCDERGTDEYNLGLGERRAAAARDYLSALGVDPKRITLVSYGKERPFCSEETEWCWSQNRRGHFIVTAK